MNRRQAITWTKDAQLTDAYYASLGLNVYPYFDYAYITDDVWPTMNYLENH